MCRKGLASLHFFLSPPFLPDRTILCVSSSHNQIRLSSGEAKSTDAAPPETSRLDRQEVYVIGRDPPPAKTASFRT